MAEERAKLANMLRECASFVDRNEFHPHMYTVLASLHSYAGAHSDASKVIESSKLVHKSSIGGAAGGAAVATHLSSLGKKIGKIALTATDKEKRAAAMSSSKHADRIKHDFHHSASGESSVNGEEWNSWWAGGSESGSVQGGSSKSNVTAATTTTAAATATTSSNQTRKVGIKPPFQRPTNPNTTLIANGWIEQLRRSKMTSKWKDVLASLVEGRNPGEETTLWVQREITSVVTGKQELEALHQIPIKWLQEVKYLDFYGENRFNIKVYNVPEEFQFRCSSEEAAQNWVLTLRSIKEIDERKRNGGGGAASVTEKAASKAKATATVKAEAEAKPKEAATKDVPREESNHGSRAGSPTRIATAGSGSPPSTPGASITAEQPRMTISELRAIAHGLGVNTIGMERADLERIAASRAAPSSSTTDPKHQKELEAARRRQEADRQEELRRKAMDAEQDLEVQQKLQEEENRRIAMEEQMRAAALAEERRRVEEQRRQQALLLEEQRRQEAIRMVEEQRRREEELRRQEEAHRAAHEAQIRYQQQQQAWQQQQAAQQAWQQQQAAAAQQRAQAAQHAQWQQWQQQQQKQQQPQQQPPFGGAQNGHSQQRAAPPQAEENTTADLKYTKMAREEDSSAGKINAVKRSILTHWALQPPQLSHLRQISDLLTTIHAVFPPAFGVAGHEYFSKWKPITREEIVPMGAGPDEEKLKKAVRKLRFFLHPDKLPRDLNAEQSFMCKMLWDVSSDSWEEYKKRHEELDWIKK